MNYKIGKQRMPQNLRFLSSWKILATILYLVYVSNIMLYSNIIYHS